jgi:hypothetical protein
MLVKPIREIEHRQLAPLWVVFAMPELLRVFGEKDIPRREFAQSYQFS